MTKDICKGYLAFTLHHMQFTNEMMISIIGTVSRDLEVIYPFKPEHFKNPIDTITIHNSVIIIEQALNKAGFKKKYIDEITTEYQCSFSHMSMAKANEYFEEDLFLFSDTDMPDIDYSYLYDHKFGGKKNYETRKY